MKKNHIEYIDVAKGITILLVIWGHIITNNFSRVFIYSFHMPLFFLLSGMFFNKEKYNSFYSFIKKRGKRLFLPFIIYSITTWIIWSFFNKLSGNSIDIWSPLIQTILAQGSGEFFKHNSPLWFIPCLFATEIMYYFISKSKKWSIIPICFIISSISIYFEYIFGNKYLLNLPWNLDAAMMALPFYAIGNLFSYNTHWHLFIENKAQNNTFHMLLITIILFILTYYFSYNYPFMSMGYSNYGNEYVFHIRAIIGTAFTCCLSAVLAKSTSLHPLKNIMLWFGKRSLDIMCTHVPIKGFLIVIIAKVLEQSTIEVTNNVIYSLLIFIFTIFIDVIVVIFIDKLKLINSKI